MQSLAQRYAGAIAPMGLVCDDCGGSGLLLKALQAVIYAGAVLAAMAGVLAAVTRFRRLSWPSWLRWCLGVVFIVQSIDVLLCGVLLSVLGLWRPREIRVHFPW